MLLLVLPVAADEFNFESSCRNAFPEETIVDSVLKKIPSPYGSRNFLTVLQELVRVSKLSRTNTV